jgi:hypothetical protein
MLASSGRTIDAAARAAVEADMAGLRKDYPGDERTEILRLEYAVSRSSAIPVAAESILRELETSQNIRVAAMAQQELAASQVDPSTRQGAAGFEVQGGGRDRCGSGETSRQGCAGGFLGDVVRSVPDGNAQRRRRVQPVAQGRVRDRGHLARSKQGAVGRVHQQAGISWPQYFDGKGWANDISSRYGINSIPSAWLVDKKGFVRTTQARGADLTERRSRRCWRSTVNQEWRFGLQTKDLSLVREQEVITRKLGIFTSMATPSSHARSRVGL